MVKRLSPKANDQAPFRLESGIWDQPYSSSWRRYWRRYGLAGIRYVYLQRRKNSCPRWTWHTHHAVRWVLTNEWSESYFDIRGREAQNAPENENKQISECSPEDFFKHSVLTLTATSTAERPGDGRHHQQICRSFHYTWCKNPELYRKARDAALKRS